MYYKPITYQHLCISWKFGKFLKPTYTFWFHFNLLLFFNFNLFQTISYKMKTNSFLILTNHNLLWNSWKFWKFHIPMYTFWFHINLLLFFNFNLFQTISYEMKTNSFLILTNHNLLWNFSNFHIPMVSLQLTFIFQLQPVSNYFL